MKKIKGSRLLFLVTAIVPTTLSALYYGLFASDVYISESRYVVRAADQTEIPSLGAMIKGGGVAAAGADNAGVVSEYVLSRDALSAVQATLDMKGAYSGDYADKPVDPLSRFPGFLEDDNMESFFEHYKKHVSVSVDPVSAASTLTVRAYDPETAHSINESILQSAEGVVNGMNQRMREDLVESARREVKAAEDRVRTAEAELSQFRASRRVVHPEQEALLQIQRTDRLRETLLEAQTRLDQVIATAPESPQIPVLRRQVASINAEISKTADRIGGSNGASLVVNSAQFQRLSIERELAAKQLAMAMDRLESAQNEAARKQIYLERIAGPSLPDGALEPRRLRAVGATFLVSLLLWGVLSVMIAGVRAHKGVA